jgi:hypothetical protein
MESRLRMHKPELERKSQLIVVLLLKPARRRQKRIMKKQFEERNKALEEQEASKESRMKRARRVAKCQEKPSASKALIRRVIGLFVTEVSLTVEASEAAPCYLSEDDHGVMLVDQAANKEMLDLTTLEQAEKNGTIEETAVIILVDCAEDSAMVVKDMDMVNADDEADEEPHKNLHSKAVKLACRKERKADHKRDSDARNKTEVGRDDARKNNKNVNNHNHAAGDVEVEVEDDAADAQLKTATEDDDGSYWYYWYSVDEQAAQQREARTMAHPQDEENNADRIAKQEQ